MRHLGLFRELARTTRRYQVVVRRVEANAASLRHRYRLVRQPCPWQGFPARAPRSMGSGVVPATRACLALAARKVRPEGYCQGILRAIGCAPALLDRRAFQFQKHIFYRVYARADVVLRRLVKNFNLHGDPTAGQGIRTVIPLVFDGQRPEQSDADESIVAW